MAKIPCPYCGGTGEIQNPRDTIRMTPDESRELLALATRTPIPPPAPPPDLSQDTIQEHLNLPRPLQPSELEITMPGSGWFERHERQQTKKQKHGILFIITFILVLTLLGAMHYYIKDKYP